MAEDDLRTQVSGGGNKAAEAEPEPAGPETISVRGQTIELPPDIAAADVRAAMQKRRSGGTLTADEQQMMRKVFAGMNRSGGGQRRSTSDYRFGGEFWVVIQNADGGARAAAVRTGVTDLDRVEIVDGLDESDRVLILPSAHLYETQEQLQQFINRRVGTLPGMGSR